MSLFKEYTVCETKNTKPDDNFFFKVEEENPRRYQTFDIVKSKTRRQTPTAQRTCFYAGLDTSSDGEVYQTITVRHKEVQSKNNLFFNFCKKYLVLDEFQILRCMKDTRLSENLHTRTGLRFYLILF